MCMANDYIAVIQAGGKGTRMREMTKGIIPKPMLLLNGKPMLMNLLLLLGTWEIR